jgi:hypothetical protein
VWDAAGVLIVHGTTKFRNRVGKSHGPPSGEAGPLGRWYATTPRWRPQVALFVHAATLLPVLMPLAPAASVLDRFPARLAEILEQHGVPQPVIEREVASLDEYSLIATASRSVVGVMNEFIHLANAYRNHNEAADLDELTMRLAQTPCGPLYKTHISPDRELAALLANNQN